MAPVSAFRFLHRIPFLLRAAALLFCLVAPLRAQIDPTNRNDPFDPDEYWDYGDTWAKHWQRYQNNTGAVASIQIGVHNMWDGSNNPQVPAYGYELISNVQPGESFWLMMEYGGNPSPGDPQTQFYEYRYVAGYTVAAAPPTVSIATNTSSMFWTGGQIQITWTSTNANAVVSTSGFSTSSVSGSTLEVVQSNQSYTTDETHTYSITVSGPGGTASASTSVTVGHKELQHVDFTFGPPTSFTYDGSPHGPTITTQPGGVAYRIASGTATETNVGSYSFTVETNQEGYEGSATCNWSISPKPITFSFGDLSQTYDGGMKSATVTADDPNATFNIDVTRGPRVGDYSVSAEAYGNYSGTGSETLRITKQPVYCDWGATQFTYDGSTKSLWHNTSNNGAVSGSGTDSAADAGSYTYSYSLNDPNNYEFANSNSQSWTIDPKPVSFTFGNLSHQYDGSPKTASVSPSDPAATYSSDLTKGPEPGSHTVSATAYGNYSGSGSDTLTIDPKEPTTFSFAPTTFVYDGSAHRPTVTTNPNGATYDSSGTSSATDVGNYSFSVNATGNYTGNDTCNWSIAAKPVTFVIGNLNPTYNGQPQPPSISPNDGNATYTVTYSGPGYGPTSTPPTNAGSYTVTVTANGNYSGSQSDTLTIDQRTPTIAWSTPTPITYGTALSGAQLNATASAPGSFSYSPASGAVLNSGAQTLTATFTPTDPTNYRVASGSVTLTVNKASLTVTAANANRVYGAANPTFSATYTGFVNGDTVAAISGAPSFSTPATSSSSANAYTITPAIGTLSAANYSFTSFANGTLTVNKAPLTVTADNQTKTYGVANPTLTISYSGFVNGDTSNSITAPNVSTTATASSSVGAYPITLSGGSAANYTLTLVNGTLTVSKATLTITANNQSRTYGAANPTLTHATTGYVNGDTAAVVAGAPSITTTATASSSVGMYAITAAAGTLAATNYQFVFVNGTLTVTRAALTVTADSQTKIYGSANPTLTYTLSGFVNSDTPSVVSGTAAVTTAATTSSGAGTYTITAAAGTLTATNYTFGPFVNGTLTITKAPLTVTANNKSKVYGAANPTLDATIAGFVNGDTSAVVSGAAAFSTPATSSSGVGAYAITPAIGSLSASNYSFTTFVNGNLTVMKAPLTATADSQSKTYGAANPTLTISYSGFVNGDTAASITAPSIGTTATASSAAGSYAITLTGGSATNYTITLVNGTLTVNKAPLTATATNQSKVYGAANPTLSIAYAGFVNGDTTSSITAPNISTTATGSSGAGSYPITLSGGSASNYTITLINGTLTVTQASLTVTANNQSKTYGAANPSLTYALSGFVNGDTVAVISGTAAVTTPATASSGVGTYPIVPTVGTLSATNYTFGSFVNGTLTIAKAALTATANNQSKTYGAVNPALAISYTGFVNGDTSSAITQPSIGTTATTGSAAGTYPITLTGGAATNYTLTLVNGTLTVGKASLTITANDQSKTYGAALPALTISYAGFVNGDTSSSITAPAIGTTATASSSVGSYPISLSGGSAANYTLTLVNGTLTISRAALTITANNQSKTYGAANPALTISYSGFVNGDTATAIIAPSANTTATASSAAGTYPIALTGGSAANYTLTLVSGTLTVTKAPLTATANDQTRAYGAANPAFTINYTGFVNGDTSSAITQPSIGTTATTGSAAGTYPITLTGGAATNYTLTLINGTLTVGKAPLTITANDQSKTYGAALPALTISYAGFVNGDTSSSITAPAIGTTATASSSVGSYPISLTGGSAANYTLTLVNGTLTISRAALTVTANNQSKTYGTANPTLTYTLTGFANGDSASVVVGAAAVTTTATTSSSAGTYVITPAIGTLSATNYTFGPFIDGTLTITKASLTATANNQSKTYGAANPALTISYSGFVNGDTATSIIVPSASTTATASSAAGTYPIALTGGSAANYTLTLVSGTLTVTKAPLTATANDQTRSYGAANPAFTINYTGFVNGDTASSITQPIASTTATTSSSVGTYAISLSGGSAANYTLTLAAGTLAITKVSLAVTANNQTKVYGAANPTLTYTLTGFVNGDTSTAVSGAPTVTTAATTASGAGTYTIATAIGTLSAANYAFGPFVNGTLTIDQAPLTATADNQTKIYGHANPALTIGYTGFVNGDTASSITPPNVSVSATTSSGVGTYAIVLSGGSAANYSVTLVNGTMTVTPAPLTVTANDQSRTYGSPNPTLTVAFSGFVNGDTMAAVTGSPSVTTTATPTSNVGSYPITPSIGTLAATNYQFTFVNGTMAVLAKAITFTFSNLSFIYDGSTKTATATPSDGAATFTPDLTKGPDAGQYTVTATATGNYTGSGTATLTIGAKIVSFTFGNLSQVYDGTVKSASVVCSDPHATFSADLTKGPNANTYQVSATANGNYSGSGNDTLVISPASQVVTLTPGTATLFVGQPATFTAAGGQNAYLWGGNAGATGSGATTSLSFASVGTYTLTVSNAASGNYLPSNTASATIDVVSNHQVNSLTPIESSYTINDSNSALNGQTYGRIWQSGGWTAYLGRSGVRFGVKAQAWPAVKTVELQAKAPGGNWTQLATQTATDTATAADMTFSVMLGGTAPGLPLVPLSYQEGNPQTGQWLFRARVQDANDAWSEFSAEVPVQVILPMITKTVSGQTVPPAGELGNWFTASAVQNFSMQFWIP